MHALSLVDNQEISDSLATSIGMTNDDVLFVSGGDIVNHHATPGTKGDRANDQESGEETSHGELLVLRWRFPLNHSPGSRMASPSLQHAHSESPIFPKPSGPTHICDHRPTLLLGIQRLIRSELCRLQRNPPWTIGSSHPANLQMK